MVFFTEKIMPGRYSICKRVAEHGIRRVKNYSWTGSKEMLNLQFEPKMTGETIALVFVSAPVQGLYLVQWFVLTPWIRSGRAEAQRPAEPAARTLWTPVPPSFLPPVTRGGLAAGLLSGAASLLHPGHHAWFWRCSVDIGKYSTVAHLRMWYNTQ